MVNATDPIQDRLPSVLIANRGEIAVRIARACRDLGLRSVALFTEFDRGAYHTRAADEQILLPGTDIASTYLKAELIVETALRTGASAIHPGYGFLSENARFAELVVDAGLRFVGPPSQVIEFVGNKLAARQLAEDQGVPSLPGTAAAGESLEDAIDFAEQHGYPLMVKAVHGGGGRGLRIVTERSQLQTAIESVRREAIAAFGRGEFFVERAILNPRHVEVQVFGEADGSILSLGDRDCSLQRRHQKLVEECPAPSLPDSMRVEMASFAVRLAEAVGYQSAGTCEFLVDTSDERVYFLEINPRLQVEHTVTEMVWGVDLVTAQLRAAAGLPSGLAVEPWIPQGHAIQVRINAEDPADDFMPSVGEVRHLAIPGGPGVRVDLGVSVGDAIDTRFDSMVSKLICWGPDRSTARARLLRAIGEFEISGVKTTLPLYPSLITDERFKSISHGTDTVESILQNGHTITESVAIARNEPAVVTFQSGGRQFQVAIPKKSGPISDEEDTDVRDASSVGLIHSDSEESVIDGLLVAPMHGTIVKCDFELGDPVDRGETVFVLEAMKMEIDLKASVTGRLTSVSYPVGSSVERGAIIGQIEPTESHLDIDRGDQGHSRADKEAMEGEHEY